MRRIAFAAAPGRRAYRRDADPIGILSHALTPPCRSAEPGTALEGLDLLQDHRRIDRDVPVDLAFCGRGHRSDDRRPDRTAVGIQPKGRKTRENSCTEKDGKN